ncbi:MAG: HAD family hydrolase [Planctomycetaceae bacterium]
MTPHRAAFFDLDDTLIDTRRLLLPDALRRTAAALGVEASRLDPGGKRIGEVVAPLGPLPPDLLAAAAAAWHAPEVPALEPLPGARAMLARLRGRLPLFLVTRGNLMRQARKLERCGLGPSFDRIVIRPIEAPGSKADDFRRLLLEHGLAPGDCVVVGDDPRDELAHGAALGCAILQVPATPFDRIADRLLGEQAG